MKILVLFPNNYDLLFLDPKRFPKYKFFFEGNSDIVSQLNDFCIQTFIEEMEKKYQNIDAIISTQDYPGMLIATILADKIGISTFSSEVSIALQHKYYSRSIQKECLPENTPKYSIVSLDKESVQNCNFSFPCFIKPVKAVFSFLATRINNKKQLQEFVEKNSDSLRIFAKPFNDILKDHPRFSIDANHFILEEILNGEQVTLDGFCCDGKVTIMGIVDSVKYPGKESFHSFEYPSKLGKDVQQRMIQMAKVFVSHSGLRNGMFNVEMFYDADEDKIDIIEINPRMFFAAADYFEKVKGINTYEICTEIALGKKPNLSNREGKFQVAATFTPRLFEDKWIKKIPTEQEIAQIKESFPDLILKLEHKAGQKLSDTIQSSGSYKYAVLNLGGKSWEDLYQKYEQVKEMLHAKFIWQEIEESSKAERIV